MEPPTPSKDSSEHLIVIEDSAVVCACGYSQTPPREHLRSTRLR